MADSSQTSRTLVTSQLFSHGGLLVEGQGNGLPDGVLRLHRNRELGGGQRREVQDRGELPLQPARPRLLLRRRIPLQVPQEEAGLQVKSRFHSIKIGLRDASAQERGEE